jgi:phosphatidylserine decarboxylase
MGRFKLGSTVINLFAPGKVQLAEPLASLSATKIGLPLAVSTEIFAAQEADVITPVAEDIVTTDDVIPLVDDKNDQG